MDKKDTKLIEKMVKQDYELKKYVDEHKEFERKLEEYKKRKHLTPEEEMERKKIQKLKLAGRDKVEEILSKYR